VAIWVTNRERHHRFIHEELLPHWGLLHVATWFWLKVTNAGELVSPLVRLIARYTATNSSIHPPPRNPPPSHSQSLTQATSSAGIWVAKLQAIKHGSSIKQETAATALGTDTYGPLAEDHVCWEIGCSIGMVSESR